jgi:putative hemolysin
VSFLTFSTELVLRLLRRHDVEETPITEDDIIALVREGAAEGSLEAAEESLITSVFSFTERTVRSLMTPRTQIFAVAIDTPVVDALRAITGAGHSRIPLYEGTLDQIAGILHVKDLLRACGDAQTIDLRTLLRPPLYVLESQRAVNALQQLKQQRSTLAIVLDEYGQVAGLITIIDLLDEVVGDLTDEYDTSEEAIVRREDGSYLVDGLAPFVDVQRSLDLPALDHEARPRDFETVAGFALALLGRIPAVGDTVDWHGYTFEVVDMDERRIDKILIQPPQLISSEQTEGALASGAVLPPPAATVEPSADQPSDDSSYSDRQND